MIHNSYAILICRSVCINVLEVNPKCAAVESRPLQSQTEECYLKCHRASSFIFYHSEPLHIYPSFKGKFEAIWLFSYIFFVPLYHVSELMLNHHCGKS